MEKSVFFDADGIQLEGLLSCQGETKAVVVSHPHPIYGGDMDSHVVTTVAGFFQKNGYASLRFNFRGVGESQGSYDDGRGEQNDVAGAVAYLQAHGATEVVLAGYSFGAWVNARFAATHGFEGDMIMVAPPVTVIDFAGLKNLKGLKLVIAGQHDEIAPPQQIKKLMPLWNPQAELVIADGTDHFYGGAQEALEQALEHFRP